MMFLGHSASRLKARSLVLGGRDQGKTAILPFFTADGLVSSVLLVHRDTGELHYFPYGLAEIKVGAWGAATVNADSLPSPEAFIHEIAQMWHFDPWWLLKRGAFARHPEEVVVAIKRSNLAAQLGPNCEAYYSRKLDRLKWIGTRTPDGGFRLEKISSMSIPKRVPMVSQEPPECGWQLDSAWLVNLIENWKS